MTKQEMIVHIYSAAIAVATTHNQVVGEKNEYYLTIAQLEKILSGLDPTSQST